MISHEQQLLALLAEAEAGTQKTWGATTGRSIGKSTFLQNLQSLKRHVDDPYKDHTPWVDTQGKVKLDVGREWNTSGACITVHMKAVDDNQHTYWVEMERLPMPARHAERSEVRRVKRACADLVAIKLGKEYVLRGKI